MPINKTLTYKVGEKVYSFSVTERKYSWLVITYAPRPVVQDFCNQFAKKYAFIYHDKDGGEPHFHILFTLQQWKSAAYFIKWFKNFGNIRIAPMIDPISSYTYLSHKNQPQKHLYSDSDIVTNDLNYFTSSPLTKEDENYKFLVDLLTKKPFEMAVKYGRDYIRNFSKYDNFRALILAQKEPLEDIIANYTGE